MAQVINGYVALPSHPDYVGMYVNGETTAVADGLMLILDSATIGTATVPAFKLPGAADTASKFRCVEIGHIFDNTPAVRFHVDTVEKNYYIGEHSDDSYYNLLEFDTTKSETKPGKFVRAHQLYAGEEFWVAFDEAPTTYTVNSTYGVLATGVIG